MKLSQAQATKRDAMAVENRLRRLAERLVRAQHTGVAPLHLLGEQLRELARDVDRLELARQSRLRNVPKSELFPFLEDVSSRWPPRYARAAVQRLEEVAAQLARHGFPHAARGLRKGNTPARVDRPMVFRGALVIALEEAHGGLGVGVIDREFLRVCARVTPGRWVSKSRTAYRVILADGSRHPRCAGHPIGFWHDADEVRAEHPGSRIVPVTLTMRLRVRRRR